MKKICGMVLACMMLFFSMFVSARAAEVQEKPLTLTVNHQYEKTPLTDVKFRVYWVGTLENTNEFVLDGDFKAYKVKITGLNNQGWKQAALTLAAYAVSDKITPLIEKQTDAKGTACFDIQKTGLYLVVGETKWLGTKQYESAPLLVMVPGQNKDGTWMSDTTVWTKVSVKEPGKQELTVMKIWNDGNSQKDRPKKIQAVLYKGSERMETVELSEENYWRHTWRGLNETEKWSVIETEVPTGYTVIYSEASGIYTITNTHKSFVPEGGYPASSGKLPTTGQLWWPVTACSVLGMLLFAFGWWENNRKDRKEE